MRYFLEQIDGGKKSRSQELLVSILLASAVLCLSVYITNVTVQLIAT
jgi:hypothetical protein